MLITKDKSFYKELIRLGIPIALGSLVTFSISLSDNMIIARLGNASASSVYLSNQVALLLTMLSAGVEAAVLSLASRYLGNSEEQSARKIASLGISSALILAAVFFVFSSFFPRTVLSVLTDKSELVESGIPFLRMLGVSFLFFAPAQAMAAVLRSLKKTKIPFFAALAALVLNIALNFVLIFGKFGISALGVFGAGIATLGARILEFLILFIYLFFVQCKLKVGFSTFFKIDKSAVKTFIKTGLPLFAAQGAWSVNTFFSSALMGRAPFNGVVAGLSVASSLYNLSYVVTNGMSGAVGIITGRLVGKADFDSFRKLSEYSKTLQWIFLSLGVLTAIFIQASKTLFVSFWGVDSAAQIWALRFINLFSLFVIGTAYQSASLNGLIKNSGEVNFIFKTESFFVFCVIIPLSLLASDFGASPLVVFALLKCDQILKCPVAYLKLKKIQKGYIKHFNSETHAQD